MLIIAIIAFGALAGGLAQLLLGSSMQTVDWKVAILAGIAGSFVGGLVVSLLSGDGLDLRPSGIIGSILGAVVVTAGYYALQGRKRT